MLKLFAMVSAAALVCGAADATPFAFTDLLQTGQMVTGTFDGDLSGNLITNMSNVSVSVDGVAFAGNGSLFTAQLGSTWEPGGIASLDGTENNFIFVDSDLGNGVAGYNNFFYSISIVGDAAQNLISGQYGTTTPPTAFRAHVIDVRGAVPEPASWAMMVGGFGLIGGALRNRRRSATVSFA
jgi:hypothetical protein